VNVAEKKTIFNLKYYFFRLMFLMFCWIYETTVHVILST